MMIRTQISLDPEQHRSAKRRSAELGISLAEYVRGLVARDVEHDAEPQGDISAIFGIFRSDEPTDIARDKDRLIGEAVEATWRRKTGDTPPAGHSESDD